jgi:hypothetical protein
VRELVAAGLVTYDFERIVRFIGGRRRAVRSRAQYTVYHTPQKPNVLSESDAQTFANPRHRAARKLNVSGGANPGIVEKPSILLKSISCTVQKMDPQVLSRLPSTGPIPTAGFEFVGERVEEGSKSSLTRARKARDVQMTNPPLPCYENFKDQFPGVTTRQFAFAVERISSRAKTPPRSQQFWQTSLTNFFAHIDAEADLFLTERAIALFQSGAPLGEVSASLKDEARARDLAFGPGLIDRIMCQAIDRVERDSLVRSETSGVGALR